MVRSATTPASESIEVQLVRLGEAVLTYVMAADSTVGDVLDKAGVGRDVTVKISGEAVSVSDLLDDGDRLTIASNADNKA